MVGQKRLRLRNPDCFFTRSLIRYELVSVFGLVIIFCVNACIEWLSGMLFNYDRAVLLLLYVKDRPDAFFWPRTPSASVVLFKWPLCEMSCFLSSILLNGTRSTSAVQVIIFLNNNKQLSCIGLLNNVNFNSWSFSSWYKPFEGSCWKRGYCLDHLKES